MLLSAVLMAQRKTGVVQGCYAISYGQSGRLMELDSNGRFYIKVYDCLSRTAIDSGSWKLNEDNSIFIQSSRFKNVFHAIQYDRYVFFISNAEKKMFDNDLAILDKEYIDGRQYGSAAWPATKPEMIYSRLIQKYFVRKL
ncbi:MAG: hypothetical protein BGO55_31165 [Sphingobacteriales bacterium 50-39]|nr:hypothetical protein [Sphingobacteriales bacterium]OJW60973.1 MAG: hypothetical protein BGO55_31165 [Sphingobacteriales bacterium 50-39]